MTLSGVLFAAVAVLLRYFMPMVPHTLLLSSLSKDRRPPVPRAELNAIIVVVCVLTPSPHAIVCSDSELCAKGFLSHQREGENAELWSTLWKLIYNFDLTLDIRWAKAHGTERPEMFCRYCITHH